MEQLNTQNVYIIGKETTLTDRDWVGQCLATYDESGEWTRETFMFLLNNRYDGDMADMELMAFFDHGDSLPEGFQINNNYNMIEH